MELPGTTPHAKARIALAKLMISFGRVELAKFSTERPLPERLDALLAELGPLAQHLALLENAIDKNLMNPPALEALMLPALPVIRIAAEIGIGVEEEFPGYGITKAQYERMPEAP